MTVLAFPMIRRRSRHKDKGENVNVILHIGAHRCATTSFQAYVRGNLAQFRRTGVGFWGPYRTRNGLLNGLIPERRGVFVSRGQRAAFERVRARLALCERQGIGRLIVSDENILGTMPRNLRAASLYPTAGERLAAVSVPFGGRVTDVVLNIRRLDQYWASAMAYGVSRGRPVPDRAVVNRVADSYRSWRDVIAEVAQAIPEARLHVFPFERFAGRPDDQLSALIGGRMPESGRDQRLNAAPRSGVFEPGMPWAGASAQPEEQRTPFTPAQAACLREAYADDLIWLASGADGLANLIEDPNENPAGANPPRPESTRGRSNDQDRRLAGAG